MKLWCGHIGWMNGFLGCTYIQTMLFDRVWSTNHHVECTQWLSVHIAECLSAMLCLVSKLDHFSVCHPLLIPPFLPPFLHWVVHKPVLIRCQMLTKYVWGIHWTQRTASISIKSCLVSVIVWSLKVGCMAWSMHLLNLSVKGYPTDIASVLACLVQYLCLILWCMSVEWPRQNITLPIF